MALRQVEWSSGNRLSCSGCANAPIILCLAPGLVNPATCQGAAQSFDFLDATIVSVSNLGGGIFRYTVEYDDANLVGVTLLIEADILGAFCKNCMSDWVEALNACGDAQGIYNELIYGNGSDGDRTVTGNETLGALNTGVATARPYFYRNLTIDAGAVLTLVGDSDGANNPQQIQVFVSGLLTINGAIEANGLDGGDAAAGTGGTQALNPTIDGAGGGGCQGANGGDAGVDAGALTENALERSPGVGWSGGGFGGAGGNGGG